ncbi:MAG: type II toxin-antitoxin system VapC family toxin [Treponema sp.]|jgi:predicted nucleic acid-binding protein|nr:type II toxin-antitoxin system VapC family toxin [Treponema sp.]
MEIIVDASAIMAVIADEAESEIVIEYTKDAIIVSPNVLAFEIANGLTKMMKRRIIEDKGKLINFIEAFKQIPIKLVEVSLEKTLEIAWDHKIYAYDAYYLEAAKRLHLPLLTFDGEMKKIGRMIGVEILGEKDASL